jgi:hypothetical protein
MGRLRSLISISYWNFEEYSLNIGCALILHKLVGCDYKMHAMFSVITFRNKFVEQTMPIHFGQVGLLGGGGGTGRERGGFSLSTSNQ